MTSAIIKIVSRAFVLLDCEIGSEDTVFDELMTINGVSNVYRTQAVYDMIVKLESSTQDELRKSIVEIRRIDAVQSSLTLLVKER